MANIFDNLAGLFKGAPEPPANATRIMPEKAPGPPAPSAKPAPPEPPPKAPETPAAPKATEAPAAPKATEAPAAPKATETPAAPQTVVGETPYDKARKNAQQRKKRSTFLDVGHEMMISGMLSGPQTHIFNMTDNTIKSLTSPMETAARALVSVGRKPGNKTYLREAAYEAYGLFHGYAQALKYIGYRTKQAIPGMPNEAIGDTIERMGLSRDLSRTSKVSSGARALTGEKVLGTSEGLLAKTIDATGALVNIPGTSLNEVDTAFKIAHFNRIKYGRAAALQAEGRAKSFNEAWSIVNNDPNIDKLAVKQAEEWTYTGEPDSYIKWILSDTADKMPLLRWVVPFRRAIANIYEHTLERSPLILTSPTLTKKLFSKDPAVADQARSKLLFGLTILTSGGMLLNDHMTGPAPGGEGITEGIAGGVAPKNRITKDMFERAYGKELTLDLSSMGGPVLETRELGVYGNFLELIAAYNQWNANVHTPPVFKNDYRNQTEKYFSDLGAFVTPMMEVLYDDHWGKNIVEFFATFNDAINDGNWSMLARWLERNLVKAMPIAGSGPVGDIAKARDPFVKKKTTPGDEFFAQIPGLRELIPNVYTWDGHPMVEDKLKYSQDSGRNMIDTLYGPKTELDIIMANHQVELKPPQDSVSIINPKTGKRIRKYMSKTEWDQFNRYRAEGINGLTIREFIQKSVINQPMWKTWAPFERKNALENAYNEFINMARKVMFGETAEAPSGAGAQAIHQLKEQLKWSTADSPGVYQSSLERLKAQPEE